MKITHIFLNPEDMEIRLADDGVTVVTNAVPLAVDPATGVASPALKHPAGALEIVVPDPGKAPFRGRGG